MAGEYTITYSNPSKGSFVIGPNIMDGPGYPNHHTPLFLPGRYVPNYGIGVAKSLVYLLENFANDTPPNDPTNGMIWFKTFAVPDIEHGLGILHVYNPDHPDAGSTGSTGWVAVGSGLGSGGSGGGGAGSNYELAPVGNFTAAPGGNYYVDTTSAAITVTLPISPSIGDVVGFVDKAGTFDINNLILVGNGESIMGDISAMTNDVKYSYFRVGYSGSANGWRLIS